MPHRFVVSFVLPLRYGVTFNGIYTLQSGYPINIYAQTTPLSTLFGSGRLRPNMVPGCDPDLGSDQSYERWFNTACWVSAGKYAFGDAPRNDDRVRMAGVNNLDLSVGKVFKLLGDTELDLRLEMFNVFNHTQFNLPNMQLGSASFGICNEQRNRQRMMQVGVRLNF